MSDRAPAYRDPALHFDALRLVALRERGRIEETLATENEIKMLLRASAHVHPAHAALCCWSKLAAHTQPALRTGRMGPAWRLLHVSWRVIPDLTCTTDQRALADSATSRLSSSIAFPGGFSEQV